MTLHSLPAAVLLHAVSISAAPSLLPPRGSGGVSRPSLPLSRRLEPGLRALAAGAPAPAFRVFRGLLAAAAQEGDPALARAARLGLGRTWLAIGRTEIALRYAAQLEREAPQDPKVQAFVIRALLRAGRFAAALARAQAARGRDPELAAAKASALYRNRRLREAGRLYRELLAARPADPEALVRLGTGLLPPRPAPILPELAAAVRAGRDGDEPRGIRLLRAVLAKDPSHPIALRLLGEAYERVARRADPLQRRGLVARLEARLAGPREAPWVREFVHPWGSLSPARRRAARAAIGPFAAWLERAFRRGARHDLLLETERTTEAAPRAWLRGRRTFDGRLWDDVRGMGGKRAATGIEALDEAARGGFQTFAHELAHQIHLFALPPRDRLRIERLYAAALRAGRTLDYYAAANPTEYFAQGVEAWLSLAKSAGLPVTHGHTRFELERRDPELAAFIAGLAAFDPLAGDGAAEVLEDCLEAASLTGRVEDARMIAARLRTLGRLRGRRDRWFAARLPFVVL